MTKLTALGIKKLAVGMHGDGDGLWLQVQGADQRSWAFRYKLHGKARQMGLGPYPDLPLAEARDAAAAQRRLIRDGIDPIDHRDARREAAKAASKAHTFKEVAELYMKSHQAGWRNDKHVQQWTASLTNYAYGLIGDRPVAGIDTPHVLLVLEPIWRVKSETASRVRGRVHAILDYAKSQGWRSGENPARWRGHLENLLPSAKDVAKVEHFAALPYAELAPFYTSLTAMPGTASLALRFVILTACRTGEAIGAQWKEFDLDAGTWIIPGARMKAGREHRVPLSAPALAILIGLKPADSKPADYVFPSTGKAGHLSNMALAALLKRMERADITVHGFRSSFRDWASEETHYSREVAEMALAHTLKDKTEAAYRRGDLFAKRAEMMTHWAVFCLTSL